MIIGGMDSSDQFINIPNFCFCLSYCFQAFARVYVKYNGAVADWKFIVVNLVKLILVKAFMPITKFYKVKCFLFVEMNYFFMDNLSVFFQNPLQNFIF